MIISGRLNENQSIQLGIAVLVGYIFGSFFINFLRKFISLENIAKLSFLIISLSFFACMMKVYLLYGRGYGDFLLVWQALL